MNQAPSPAIRGTSEIRALKLAVAVYLVVFVLKIAVFLVTGVMALFAEAFHTLSDIIISGFLLFAAIWSSKGADKEHLFGHGRAQGVAALVAATLFISFTSFKLYEEAIPRLYTHEAAVYQNLPLALGVIAVSMVISAVPFISFLRIKNRGPLAKAQMRELINDELGLVAALAGTLFIIWGEPLADPVAAIIVATVIAYAAVRLFRENMSMLLGTSPGPEFIKKLETAARSVEGVVGVHKILAEYVGPNAIHAGFHIEVKRGMSIEDGDRIAIEVHKRVTEATGCRYLVIHVDPEGAPRLA
jgi:cation diffusion facilitator family transporter